MLLNNQTRNLIYIYIGGGNSLVTDDPTMRKVKRNTQQVEKQDLSNDGRSFLHLTHYY